jgi:hypothetical protein
MQLPWRHIFFIRKIFELQICYAEMIPLRWKNRRVTNSANAQATTIDSNKRKTIIISNMNSVNAFMTSQEELPSSQSPSSSQSSTNRFTEIHRLFQELAQTIFTASSDMQYDRIQQLLTLRESWENNITTMIQPLILIK